VQSSLPADLLKSAPVQPPQPPAGQPPVPPASPAQPGSAPGGRRSRADEDAQARAESRPAGANEQTRAESRPGGRRAADADDARGSRRASADGEDAGRRARDEAPAGRRAAREATGETPLLRPGDVDQAAIAFWDEAASDQFRAEWHEVKAQFVDDPVAALTRAQALLTEAVQDLGAAMLAERDRLDPLRDSATPDTESMRMAMRGYREFLDRILSL
jgi:hypothetical protein